MEETPFLSFHQRQKYQITFNILSFLFFSLCFLSCSWRVDYDCWRVKCWVVQLTLAQLNSAVVQSVKSEWKKERIEPTSRQNYRQTQHSKTHQTQRKCVLHCHEHLDGLLQYVFIRSMCVFVCIPKSITINGKVFADDGDCEWRWQSLMRKNDMMIITMASRYNVWIFSKKIVYTVYIRDNTSIVDFINCYYYSSTTTAALMLLCFTTSKSFQEWIYTRFVAVDDESNIVDWVKENNHIISLIDTSQTCHVLEKQRVWQAAQYDNVL